MWKLSPPPPPPPKDCIIIKSLNGEGDASRSGVYGARIFGIMGSQSLLHLGALSVWLITV